MDFIEADENESLAVAPRHVLCRQDTQGTASVEAPNFLSLALDMLP